MSKHATWITVTVASIAVGFLVPIALVVREALGPATASDAPWEILRASPVPSVALESLRVCLVVSALALPVALVIAYPLSRATTGVRVLGTALCSLPLLLNLLVIILAWLIILERDGVLNWALSSLGLVSKPLQLLFTRGATYAAMLYALVPVMALLLLHSLVRVEPSTRETAGLLGAGRVRTFVLVEVGQVLPAVAASLLMGFIIAFNLFLIPEYLTGPDLTLLPLLVQQSVIRSFDLRTAAILSSAILAFMTIPLTLGWLIERWGRDDG